MFRKICYNKHLLSVTRRFSNEKKITASSGWKRKDSKESIRVKSELKENNIGWKATNGDGKSIYDCENELWCELPETDKK